MGWKSPETLLWGSCYGVILEEGEEVWFVQRGVRQVAIVVPSERSEMRTSAQLRLLKGRESYYSTHIYGAGLVCSYGSSGDGAVSRWREFAGVLHDAVIGRGGGSWGACAESPSSTGGVVSTAAQIKHLLARTVSELVEPRQGSPNDSSIDLKSSMQSGMRSHRCCHL